MLTYSVLNFVFLMLRLPPRVTRTDTLFPSPTLFLSPPAIHLHRRERSRLTIKVIASADGLCVPRLAALSFVDNADAVERAEPKHFIWISRAENLGAALDQSSAQILDGFTLRAHFSARSEEHTSELQSLMRISYAVFCLKQKKYRISITTTS